MTKTAVIAVGGNSLITDKDHQSVDDQRRQVEKTVLHIVSLVEDGYEVVMTHGNGPQVGFILLRSEFARQRLHTVPLDSCGADTQGAIGYNFQMAMRNELRRRSLNKPVATVVTQVVVDKNDPAFQNPSKPIGPFYTYEEAMERQKTEGWDMMEDAGRGWRRVVPSPRPIEILEFSVIKRLLDSSVFVIGVGGGGIPVIKKENGDIYGVPAVIDKDLASSLLASDLKADLFIISTDVEKVCLNYGKPDQKPLDRVSLEEAKKFMEEGHFATGSMKPKVESIIEYLEKGGKEALITNFEHLEDALDGKSGTWFYQ